MRWAARAAPLSAASDRACAPSRRFVSLSRLVSQFQRDYETTSAAQKQDLNRRFSEGYKLLLARNGGALPPELEATRQRLVNYSHTLQARGVEDEEKNDRSVDRSIGRVLVVGAA